MDEKMMNLRKPKRGYEVKERKGRNEKTKNEKTDKRLLNKYRREYIEKERWKERLNDGVQTENCLKRN